MSWLDKYRILSYRLNPADYPDYTRSERVSDIPGLVLIEHHVVRSIRWSVTVGCALSTIYFFAVVRPRLAFADRPLVKLHHYFYPSAGYATPVGLAGGLLYGAHTEGQWVQRDDVPLSEDTSSPPASRFPSSLAKAQAARESRAAVAAYQQYERHRQDVADELRKARHKASILSSLGAVVGLGDSTVRTQLTKLGLGEKKKWTDFLEPYGLLWTRLHSCVHDRRFYKDYCGPVVEENTAVPSNTSPPPLPARGTTTAVSTTSSAGTADPPLPQPGEPPASPIFSKEQVDVLVSRASSLRHSADENRWTRSAGRFATYGIATTVLAWNSGGLLFRVSMGLGLGVVAGAMVSATRLDDAFTRL